MSNELIEKIDNDLTNKVFEILEKEFTPNYEKFWNFIEKSFESEGYYSYLHHAIEDKNFDLTTSAKELSELFIEEFLNQ
jgi:hypothetical protein